jgi:DNA-binding response OmpR family regulator
MVISSEPVSSQELINKLIEQGYDVNYTTDNGEKLRINIDRILPDLVIISMGISCIEAVELCLRVRRWCQVPLILVHNREAIPGLVNPEAENCPLVKTDTIDDLMLRIERTFSKN